MRCSKAPVQIPWMVECDLIAIARGSIASTKSRGESGEPCLVPRLSLNEGEIKLLVSILAEESTKIISIHLRKKTPKPNLASISIKYGHSSLSNAFSASRDRMAVSGAPSPACTRLRTLLTLWNDWLFLIKPFWAFVIYNAFKRNI